MSVGEITVGVMTVGVMRRPQKNTSQGIEKNKSTKPTVEKNYKSYLSFFGKAEVNHVDLSCIFSLREN